MSWVSEGMGLIFEIVDCAHYVFDQVPKKNLSSDSCIEIDSINNTNATLTEASLASNDLGNVAFAKLALQYGATLFLEKPITIEVLKTLWQHVVKDKIMKARTAHKKEKITAFDGETVGTESEDIAYYEYNRLEINQNIEMKEEVNGAASESGNKRRSYTRWTEERHRKFVAAMFQLDCYPKDILELMNEPNLTRLQVASHLQKCRLGKWRGPKSDKNFISIRPNNNAGVRKYGKMPNLEMLKISQAPPKQEYQEARDTYELPFMGNNFGDYPSEKFSPNFGVDFDEKFVDEVPNNNYQLPATDDTLSFSQLLGFEPFNKSGSVQENFHLGSNFNFSCQPHGGRGV